MAILADTGFLIALLDRDDPHHDRSRKLAELRSEPLVVPTVVLPEVCYLTHKFLGPRAELVFLDSLLAGEFVLEWMEPADLRRATEILRSRPEFGMVDATVMATAERLKLRKVATFDLRHFGSFAPSHCRAFELLP